MFNCSKSPYICYRDKYPCKVSEKKNFFFNPFIIKNGEYDPRKLAIDKILDNSGPLCTWILYPSQG